MPTDGTRASSRRSSTSNKVTKAVVEPVAPHRRMDAMGLMLIASAIILFVVLIAGNGGVLGDGLALFFKSLFGKGAWVVPAILAFSGITLLTGRSRVQVTRVSWGATLVFVAAIGAFARDLNGDYFDPDVIRDSGGFVGAAAGYVLSLLLGVAKPVGVALLIALGIGICVDMPIRELLGWMRDRAKRRAIDARIQEAIESEEKPKPTRTRKWADQEDADAPATRRPEPETRKQPRITEGSPKPSEVDFSNPEPKEGYTLPALSLLTEPQSKHKRSPQEMQRNIETLEGTLEQFGIDANVVEVANGPTITRYEIQLGPGIRVNRITALADNIAMSLAASHVRVEAPIRANPPSASRFPTTSASW